MISTTTYLGDQPEIQDRLEKWQEIVNIIGEVFGASAALICQSTEEGFRPVVSSDQDSNPYAVGAVFPWEAHTFCRHVSKIEAPLYVMNAEADDFWKASPVYQQDGFRSYYGMPIFWPEQDFFGTICVMDQAATAYDDKFIHLLSCFRDLVEADLISLSRYLNKTEFLAAVSHELRTPMNGIVGMTEALLNSELSGDQRGSVETIRDCAETLTSLLNDILDIARIEAGRLDLDLTEFNIAEHVQYADRLWRPRAESKGLKFRIMVGSDVPVRLRGDERRLRQILSNLLSNAIKFTESGTVSVDVTTVALETGSVRLRVEVRDTGPGLDPACIGKLFQKFIQADASIVRRYGGTGLGLSISRNLVELMDGTIDVQSTPGEGSTFYFELPLDVIDGPSAALVEERNIFSSDVARGMQILVVEDNPINQRVFRALMDPLGCETDYVSNGREAVARVAEKQFDFILMDIEMPVMGGIDATKEIRGLGGWCATVPIVAMTANAMVGDKEQYIDAGMDTYLSKPIDPKRFIAMLRENRADLSRA